MYFRPSFGVKKGARGSIRTRMLRAGLVGLPSSGKTTLFQLLTSAREAARTHGKAEANQACQSLQKSGFNCFPVAP